MRRLPTHPWASATAFTVFAISARTFFRVSASNVRTVPESSAVAGMTLHAGVEPATKLQTEITTGCVGSMRRVTTVWSAPTNSAPQGMGSTAICGRAPCPPFPSMVT